jgi:hypothetical protein
MFPISIPSEFCPHCRRPEGFCLVAVQEIKTLREVSVKLEESDFRADMNGYIRPRYREAYLAQNYICLEGKGENK